MSLAINALWFDLTECLAEHGYELGSEEFKRLKPSLIEMWSTSFNQGMGDMVAALESDDVVTKCEACGAEGTVGLVPDVADEGTIAKLEPPEWLDG